MLVKEQLMAEIKKIAGILKEKVPGIYVDVPVELDVDDEGDIVIDVFNVAENIEASLFGIAFSAAKDILWPNNIYNVIFVPHTPEATQKYYIDRLPECLIKLGD